MQRAAPRIFRPGMSSTPCSACSRATCPRRLRNRSSASRASAPASAARQLTRAQLQEMLDPIERSPDLLLSDPPRPRPRRYALLEAFTRRAGRPRRRAGGGGGADPHRGRHRPCPQRSARAGGDARLHAGRRTGLAPATAVSELARNIVQYAGEGVIELNPSTLPPGLEIGALFRLGELQPHPRHHRLARHARPGRAVLSAPTYRRGGPRDDGHRVLEGGVMRPDRHRVSTAGRARRCAATSVITLFAHGTTLCPPTASVTAPRRTRPRAPASLRHRSTPPIRWSPCAGGMNAALAGLRGAAVSAVRARSPARLFGAGG